MHRTREVQEKHTTLPLLTSHHDVGKFESPRWRCAPSRAAVLFQAIGYRPEGNDTPRLPFDVESQQNSETAFSNLLGIPSEPINHFGRNNADSAALTRSCPVEAINLLSTPATLASEVETLVISPPIGTVRKSRSMSKTAFWSRAGMCAALVTTRITVVTWRTEAR